MTTLDERRAHYGEHRRAGVVYGSCICVKSSLELARVTGVVQWLIQPACTYHQAAARFPLDHSIPWNCPTYWDGGCNCDPVTWTLMDANTGSLSVSWDGDDLGEPPDEAVDALRHDATLLLLPFDSAGRPHYAYDGITHDDVIDEGSEVDDG